jgi:hypothetical protein
MALPLPIDTIVRAGLACVPMVLVVSMLPDMAEIPELALKGGLGAAVYGVSAWLLDAGGLRSPGRTLLRTLRPRAAS